MGRVSRAETGAHLPSVRQEWPGLDLAERYAPHLLLDQKEPFLPVAVGYTIFERDGYSPSFPRCIGLAPVGRPLAAKAIEYAIWWDWDIGHLYELEHVWVYLDEGEKVLYSEFSWHGGCFGTRDLLLDGTHVVFYSEPGKHALSPSAEVFEKQRPYDERHYQERAGAVGLMVTPIFEGVLEKTPEKDALAEAYLKARVFLPSYEFTQRFVISRDILLPWPELKRWIPQRVAWLLEQLRQGAGA